MSDPFETLSTRLEADAFFLASALAAYAQGEQLDDDALAEVLGVMPTDILDLKMCRSPRSPPLEFRADLNRLAERFDADPQRLAAVVRRGQCLLALRGSPSMQHGTVLAAREVSPRRESS
jgi:hypothetical protein